METGQDKVRLESDTYIFRMFLLPNLARLNIFTKGWSTAVDSLLVGTPTSYKNICAGKSENWSSLSRASNMCLLQVICPSSQRYFIKKKRLLGPPDNLLQE